MDVMLIVARGRNGVIGRDGALPWRLRSDLVQFKAETMGRPVVMGRKTWDSIGKPLPGRRNIVISRDSNFRAVGALTCPDPGAALACAAACASEMSADRICVIGGGAIYRALMPIATHIRMTDVDAEPVGDVAFEEPEGSAWLEVERTPYPAGLGDDASFVVRLLKRR